MAGDLEWLCSVRVTPISLEKTHVHTNTHTHTHNTYLYVHIYSCTQAEITANTLDKCPYLHTRKHTMIAQTHACKHIQQTLTERLIGVEERKKHTVDHQKENKVRRKELILYFF